MTRFCRLWFLLLLLPLSPCKLLAQLELIGAISGQLRIVGGDVPSHQIMIELRLHQAAISSVYCDAEGRFGFPNLPAGPYHIVINDDAYSPVDELVNLRPENPNAFLRIDLRPRRVPENSYHTDPAASGGNRFLVDPSEYNKHFPKKAIKEYDKGVAAGKRGEHKDAVAHYQAALQIAPDYYPAHNNLGSEYLSESDFAGARNEFEHVIRLNQSDATAYFNLSNVCLLLGQLPDAQHSLDEGLRREPNSALGHFLLGSLAMRQGKYAQAEAALRQAIETSPKMAPPRLQLVNLLLQQGRQSDAANELNAFVAAFPTSPFVPKARQLLERLEEGTVKESRDK